MEQVSHNTCYMSPTLDTARNPEKKEKKEKYFEFKFQDKMGKNHKKVDKVFKVAGAKSLKLKAKAKTVKSELKQINIKNKSKVAEIDKALQLMQNTVRNTNKAKKDNPEITKTKLPSSNPKDLVDTQKKSEDVMNDLDKMQL
nr:uncharacterized protein LOC111508895 isoform X1 [Leptinotarsa decemlineata]